MFRAAPPVLVLAAALFSAPLPGQETSSEPRVTKSPEGKRVDTNSESLFSDDEINRFYQKGTSASQRQREAEAFIYGNVEGPIIELEPFIVESDDSLMLARVRRRMEQRQESLERRVAELSPILRSQADYDARASDRFFTEPLRIGPADRPSPGGVTASEIQRAISNAIRAIFDTEE